MALVGSGRARVLCGVRVTGDCRGSRSVSGRTKVQMRFEDDEVKRVVPSADLDCCECGTTKEEGLETYYHCTLLKKASWL